MKKRKGIWMALLTVILSVAMLMGTTTIGAFALGVDNGFQSSNVTFVKKLSYGKETDKFSGATKVVAPSGTPFEKDALAAFTPKEIGAYTVYYGEGYSYVVPCVLDKDYELRVAHNGADIATYMQAGETLTVPNAAVWAKTDDSASDYEYIKVDDMEVKWEIDGENVNSTDVVSVQNGSAATDSEVVIKKPGTYTVHYYCTVKGGNKYLFKDYTVKVQAHFNDSTVPTLNVVNIPKEISLNTKITLPKATATDNYDSNVKVLVTVIAPDGNPVKRVKLGEDKYAVETLTEDVLFENDYNLSFYPTQKGKYKITYTAVDDNPNNKTPSTIHNYETEAVDRTAPVLKEIEDEKIPTKWGINVTKKKEGTTSNETESVDTKITFPYPNYVDNFDKENITVVFEIKDTVNNKTVVRFENIYDQNEDGTPGDNAKYSYNASKQSSGIYGAKDGEKLEFTKEGLKNFDFGVYKNSIEKVEGEGTSYTGTYTVSYQARDSVNNITTKTYDIVLEENFNDTTAPSIRELSFGDDYFLFTADEEEFTLPTPVITDETDTRPVVEYKLWAGAPDAEGSKSIPVNGGDTVKLKLNTDNKPTITLENKFDATKNETLVFEANVECYYTVDATDDAGNKYRQTNYNADASKNKPIKIINSSANEFTSLPEIDTTALKETFGVKESETSPEQEWVLKQGVDNPLGDITFAVDSSIREFVGFEISFTVDGKVWNTGDVSLETFYDGTNLHVQNITVAPPKSDDISMYFRVFNVVGLSKTIKVDYKTDGKSDDSGNIGAALDVGTTGNVYTSYLLRNKNVSKPEDIAPDKLYVVRKIEGKGKFSLMSSLFTAYNAGSFTFTDGYYKTGSSDITPLSKVPSYTVAISESATPVWQVMGKMPTYKAKNAKVELPAVVASSQYANAKIEVSVTDPDSKALDVVKDDVNKDLDAEYENGNVVLRNGKYEFKAKKDGSYTVTYTASYGDSQKMTQSYTIKAGDVVAPTFTVSEPAARATENSVFKFSAVTVTSEEDLKSDVKSSIRYQKTLKAPDGTAVYTVDGRGDTYRDKTMDDTNKGYTFTKTGNYTVEYVVYDKVGNSSVTSYTINVSAAKVNNPVSTKIISTILIIVGVLLIAGVILYFVRFRKVKSK